MLGSHWLRVCMDLRRSCLKPLLSYLKQTYKQTNNYKAFLFKLRKKDRWEQGPFGLSLELPSGPSGFLPMWTMQSLQRGARLQCFCKDNPGSSECAFSQVFAIRHRFNFYYRCSTYSHRQAYEWVYPQCTFSRGSCCFCATVIATRKAPEILEITYYASITASNFYPDA